MSPELELIRDLGRLERRHQWMEPAVLELYDCLILYVRERVPEAHVAPLWSWDIIDRPSDN